MTEETNAVPLASSYLDKAVKEMNENDGKGIVASIKMHIKLVTANNVAITKLQKSNDDLIKEINKLAGTGGVKVEDFSL